VIAQLTPDEPLSPRVAVVGDMQPWKDDYPWLHQALTQIGPSARGASDGWRMRIQDELKTTLDFKVRPDGTAAVWCGMSGYDFHHYPTPKELFEGLADAYRREVKRKGIGGSNPWKMSAGAGPARPEWPKPPVRAFPPSAEYSLTRTLGLALLLHAEHLVLIFLAVLVLTLALATTAIAVR
jgi:hypothetical protein